jgi:hypothetical protein
VTPLFSEISIHLYHRALRDGQRARLLGSVSVSLDSGIIVSGFRRDMNGKMSQKQGMTKKRPNNERKITKFCFLKFR